MIKVGDADPVPVEPIELFPESPASGGVDPRLINDPAAWAACFGPVRNPEYTLTNFTLNAPKLGQYTIKLQCGSSVFGWHHIQEQHQAQWQKRLDAANEHGPGPVNTWDDFMAMATAAVLRDPFWYTVEYSGKRCFTQDIVISRNSDGAEIFRAEPTVIVSMSNNRIISSYPTTTQDCTRQAPWAQ